MTQEELMLFKELLRETVRSTVKEVIKEELAPFLKKDLKEVKLLLAKSIKESMAIKESGYTPQRTTLSGEDRARLRESVENDDLREMMTMRKKMPMMSSDQAMQISLNGTLPDIDAPIPIMKKDSIAWRELQERIIK